MSDDENLYATEDSRYSFDDTETVILNTASQREDGIVLPIPESITANPEQARRKLKRLIKVGLIEEVPAKLEDGLWRKDKDDRHLTLELTAEGRRALNGFDEGPGLAPPEGDDRSDSERACLEPTSRPVTPAVRRSQKTSTRTIPTGSDTSNASRTPDKTKAQRAVAAPTITRSITIKKTPKSPPRQRKPRRHAKESKGAQLLAALGRVRGATPEELMKLSGWQAHSVRGFLSGTVKKKLKLKLRSEIDGKGVRRYQVPPPRKKA